MMESAVVLAVTVCLAAVCRAVTIVQEVNIGDTAVLICPSNDDLHRFQFWHLERENRMVGPTNKFNRDKYKYEVLTGTLNIRAVSSNEHGLYTCVSKHINDNSFYSETIELIVKKDWEEVYETDPYTNMFRLIIIVIVVLILAALVFVVYNQRSDKAARFRAMADEESPDEAGPSYADGSASGRLLSDLDSHGLDTELPRPPAFTDVRLGDSGI